MATSNKHLAAILTAKGEPLKVEDRPTPTPGPTDIVIDVKSIALNPLDYIMRELGFAVAQYPAVLGHDLAGTIHSVGSSSTLKAGTRVAAFAPTFFVHAAPDYGAFQKKVLVPATNVVVIPDEISFSEAAKLPTSVNTAWTGFYILGIGRETKHSPSDKKGLLVWGASSSIGSGTVQLAKLMGFTVYATAGEKHHEYIKSLGASKVFEYRGGNAPEQIIKAAKEDGVTIEFGFDAVGQVAASIEVLKGTSQGTAKLATAVPPGPDTPKSDEVEVLFISSPPEGEARSEHFNFVFGTWLPKKLEKKEWVPSPKLQVVNGGLEAINNALDVLHKGVSGVKLVVEV